MQHEPTRQRPRAEEGADSQPRIGPIAGGTVTGQGGSRLSTTDRSNSRGEVTDAVVSPASAANSAEFAGGVVGRFWTSGPVHFPFAVPSSRDALAQHPCGQASRRRAEAIHTRRSDTTRARRLSCSRLWAKQACRCGRRGMHRSTRTAQRGDLRVPHPYRTLRPRVALGDAS